MRGFLRRLLKWTLRLGAILVVLYLYFHFLHPHERAADHVYFRKPSPWAIAHRGGRGLAPENTLAAFDNAAALGVDVLEMDVRVTLDGAFAVIHDASVDRTTSGSGRIEVMNLADVRALDAGYKFRDAAGNYTFRGKGVRIPTLEEVIERFPSHLLNIEMKEFEIPQAQQLCRLLQQRGALDRVLIASFHQDAMDAFREACPSVATSATLREGTTLYYLNRIGIPSLYRGAAVAVQMPERFGRMQFLNPAIVSRAADYNLKVQIWTVNEEDDMKRMLALGVHGILTDYPDRLLRLMGRAR